MFLPMFWGSSNAWNVINDKPNAYKMQMSWYIHAAKRNSNLCSSSHSLSCLCKTKRTTRKSCCLQDLRLMIFFIHIMRFWFLKPTNKHQRCIVQHALFVERILQTDWHNVQSAQYFSISSAWAALLTMPKSADCTYFCSISRFSCQKHFF